ncbi:hypothetical protein EYF80_048407 [Liparis tanakae]|uniref:Uncharacterized protein n=1 Tax=Liparis tanakae TaxID=230148 RepID=A0A4Z2FMA2_9TELE|nr:hypothetical protein EYF80_048407 [Liparis tanakae]
MNRGLLYGRMYRSVHGLLSAFSFVAVFLRGGARGGGARAPPREAHRKPTCPHNPTKHSP